MHHRALLAVDGRPHRRSVPVSLLEDEERRPARRRHDGCARLLVDDRPAEQLRVERSQRRRVRRLDGGSPPHALASVIASGRVWRRRRSGASPAQVGQLREAIDDRCEVADAAASPGPPPTIVSVMPCAALRRRAAVSTSTAAGPIRPSPAQVHGDPPDVRRAEHRQRDRVGQLVPVGQVDRTRDAQDRLVGGALGVQVEVPAARARRRRVRRGRPAQRLVEQLARDRLQADGRGLHHPARELAQPGVVPLRALLEDAEGRVLVDTVGEHEDALGLVDRRVRLQRERQLRVHALGQERVVGRGDVDQEPGQVAVPVAGDREHDAVRGLPTCPRGSSRPRAGRAPSKHPSRASTTTARSSRWTWVSRSSRVGTTSPGCMPWMRNMWSDHHHRSVAAANRKRPTCVLVAVIGTPRGGAVRGPALEARS